MGKKDKVGAKILAQEEKDKEAKAKAKAAKAKAKTKLAAAKAKATKTKKKVATKAKRAKPAKATKSKTKAKKLFEITTSVISVPAAVLAGSLAVVGAAWAVVQPRVRIASAGSQAQPLIG